MNNSKFDEDLPVYSFNAEFSHRVLSVSVIFGLTACLGFFANLLVICVYGIKYKSCNFKYFLFVMGLIGIVQCTIILPVQVAEMHYWFMFPTSWLCRVSALAFGFTVIDCHCVLLLIALDRFRKVCYPHRWQIQPNTARNLCILVSMASLIFAAPLGIICGHHSFVTSYHGVNITVTVCETDDIYNNRTWAVYFLLLLGGIPVSTIILITCVLYVLILKQFYNGPAFVVKSAYTIPNVDSVFEHPTTDTKEPSAVRSNENIAVVSLPSKHVLINDPKMEPKSHIYDKLLHWVTMLKNILPHTDSSRSDIFSSSGPLRTSAESKTTRHGVRTKLLRKTLIVLIITVTCIIALVITFCLQTVAEDVNNNVLTISTLQLNAFVIFHRGSFSIICAIFPIVYGIRDPKFKLVIRELFWTRTQTESNGGTLGRDDSKC